MPEKIVLEQDKNIKTKEVERPVDTPADFTSPEVLYQDLITEIKKYHPSSDLSDIEKAYKVAYKAHEGQKRKSGEPYIIHPIAVANILADLELDMEVIAAGLLHDVVEDTPYTYEDITELFGKDIADLVDGVTKLGKIKYQTKEESQAENLRKMFLAMAKDIRVILIKLADRLHNMRTLKFMPEEKAKYKAKETLEIYGGIAHRIGISKIKWELEDLALKYIDPEGYRELSDKITMKRSQRQEYIDKIVHLLEEKFKEVDINCEVSGRPKHFYSIYKKSAYLINGSVCGSQRDKAKIVACRSGNAP